MEFVFAILDVQLQQTTTWQNIGYDLDGLVTDSSGEPRECTPAQDSLGNTFLPADGVDGVDNVFGQALWPAIDIQLPTLQCEMDAAHRGGRGTIGVRVLGWNGMADDAQVEVQIATSIDGTSAPDNDVEWDDTNRNLVLRSDGSPAPEPNWDGAAPPRLFLNPAAFANGDIDRPLLLDQNAYIANNELIVSIDPAAEFNLYTDNRGVNIVFSQGILRAQLSVPDGGGPPEVSSGFISGRYSTNRLQQVGEQIGVGCGLTGEDLDEVNRVYAELADVLAQPRTGAADENAVCNAISMGIAFSGRPASWGTQNLLDAATAWELPRYCDFEEPRPFISECPSR